jgi:hypothetical protein
MQSIDSTENCSVTSELYVLRACLLAPCPAVTSRSFGA